MRQILYCLFSALLCGLFIIPAWSQSSVRKYATTKVHYRLLSENPEMRTQRNQIEQFTKSVEDELNLDEEITIPIVFHVLYADQREAVSVEQINAQIEALNRDFGSINLDDEHRALEKEGFGKLAGNMNIKFCLAIPEGDLVPAINYAQTSTTEWQTDDAIKSERGGALPIEPKKYLNIWVGKLGDNVGGYAQMPGGNEATDGIVIDYRYLGTNPDKEKYSQGKTLTHLIGNYLNLFDLGADGNCLDDKVEDTPIHNYPNYYCSPYKHVSLCDGRPVEMTMNFMDATPDECSFMFTQGQVRRARAILHEGGARENLKGSISSCEAEKLSDANDLPQSILTQLFPNPANNTLFVKLEPPYSSDIKLEIFTAEGKRIFQRNIRCEGTHMEEIDCQNWQAGQYVLSLINEDGVSKNRFFNILH